MGVSHEPEPGVAPGNAFSIFHTRPGEVVVEGEYVLAKGIQEVIHGGDDALEVGPRTLKEVEGLRAGGDQQVQFFG